jgi:hypothetical protein
MVYKKLEVIHAWKFIGASFGYAVSMGQFRWPSYGAARSRLSEASGGNPCIASKQNGLDSKGDECNEARITFGGERTRSSDQNNV